MDIFCNIGSQRNSFAVVKENEHAFLIVDINQSYRWHLLIIPKQHTDNISQVDEKTWVEGFAPLIAYGIQQLQKDPEIVGFHLNTNAGSGAHQSVFHTHIHLVPHYKSGKGFKTSFQDSANPGYRKFEWDLTWKTEVEVKNSCQRFFSDFQAHLAKRENSWGLTSSTNGVIENFHLFARVGQVDGGNYEKCHVHFIPDPRRDNKFDWMDGFDTKSTSMKERNEVRDQILALSDSEKPTDRLPPIPPPSPAPENPLPRNPNLPPYPPFIDRKQEIKNGIALSENISKIEDCFNQIVALSDPQDKEELIKDLANCLEKIIKNTNDVVKLNALESGCKSSQFCLQNDELNKKVAQMCSAQRVELDRNTSFSEKPKNVSGNLGLIVFLAILFVGGILVFDLRRKKNLRKRKTR